jgi:hypothetical protein
MSFEAKYHGKCGGCGEHIEPGDRVKFAGDVLEHDECEAPTYGEDKPLDVCPDCWLVKPCGCDS